jgi:hypothetical protein
VFIADIFQSPPKPQSSKGGAASNFHDATDAVMHLNLRLSGSHAPTSLPPCHNAIGEPHTDCCGEIPDRHSQQMPIRTGIEETLDRDEIETEASGVVDGEPAPGEGGR